MSSFRFGLPVLLVSAVVALVMVVVPRIGSSVGTGIDSYRGVTIYDNGPLIEKSHGRNYSADGYYYGKKWQCVEFVKRFYREVLKHEMPDGWGHAKTFFDESVPDGACNSRRGLLQFANGSTTAPRADDLIVFDGALGHVAIVSDVADNSIELVQQNVPGTPRDRFEMTVSQGHYWITAPRRPAGWLRKQSPGSTSPGTAYVGVRASGTLGASRASSTAAALLTAAGGSGGRTPRSPTSARSAGSRRSGPSLSPGTSASAIPATPAAQRW